MALDLPQIITASEAGQILQRSARTVARLIESGDLAVIRKLPGPNGDYLLRRADVERFSKQRKRTIRIDLPNAGRSLRAG